jgi:hypothetical protein
LLFGEVLVVHLHGFVLTGSLIELIFPLHIHNVFLDLNEVGREWLDELGLSGRPTEQRAIRRSHNTGQMVAGLSVLCVRVDRHVRARLQLDFELLDFHKLASCVEKAQRVYILVA